MDTDYLLNIIFMAEIEVSGSQELRTEIAKDPSRTNHQFTRSQFIESVKHF